MVALLPARHVFALTVLAWLALPLLGAGQERAQPLLVDAAWVRANLDSSDLVLLHVGEPGDYASAHIPGAVHLGRADFSAPSGGADDLTLELPDPEVFQRFLREVGVSDASRIVVYWGSEWVTPTTRLLYTLDWAGLGARTSILDGGMNAWTGADYPTSSEVPSPVPGDVTVEPRDELVVDAGWVEANAVAARYQLVDARSAAFFTGVQSHGTQAGHVPTSGHLYWAELVDEETLLFRSRDEMRRLLSAAGVEEGETVVAYCHIGQYATAVLFAARVLGHDVKLFDGAMEDWDARGLPVEAGGTDTR